jgi:SMODS and SLOG-associating 2TM effector domain 3/SMODS and SLOG-associating 2TM effector domain 1
LSLSSQQIFFRTLFLHLLSLVIAAVISVINSQLPEMAILQAVVLLGALACSIYLFSVRPDRYWYAGRAVAESIKTVTWRFVSKAEPFNTDDEEARHHFRQTLKSIIEQNKDVAQRLSDNLEGLQITNSMVAMRQKNFEDRSQAYIDFRISEQQRWYAKKSAHNKKMATQFFAALIITNTIAVVFAIAKIRFPNIPYWPTDALVAFAASILSWVQAKRFSELSASYALAAHEISLVREQSASVQTDEDLSKFVGDAENAFSREHTQWVARKDT